MYNHENDLSISAPSVRGMHFDPKYLLDEALIGDPDERRFVIVDGDGNLHREGSQWLSFLHDVKRSPNTIRNYGRRVAWYLSWTSLTADWRSAGLSHLAMWKRTLLSTPYIKSNGVEALRSDGTVGGWMTAVRSFYEWADANGEVATDLVSRMTELQYLAPGTPGGGEFGVTRRVLVQELRADSRSSAESDPEWVDDAGARERLELLDLNVRDRFLIDLLYFTGIRIGEALSLFKGDMHFGGGSPDGDCRYVDPHFHVRLDNPVENGAEAKGMARMLSASPLLVERYIDLVLERQRILGDEDVSPHVFVNLYTGNEDRFGRAMTYDGARDLLQRVGRRIGFDLNGPHILRHTLATRLIRGIDCEPQPTDVVSSILGHRSSKSVRVYTHDTERAKQDALLAIAPRVAVLDGE